jgi:hypothetical protein
MTFRELRARQRARQDAETREWLVALLDGRTPAEAARVAGLDRSRIYRLADLHGVECRRTADDGLTPEQRADMVRFRAYYPAAEARKLLTARQLSG